MGRFLDRKYAGVDFTQCDRKGLKSKFIVQSAFLRKKFFFQKIITRKKNILVTSHLVKFKFKVLFGCEKSLREKTKYVFRDMQFRFFFLQFLLIVD